MLSKQSALLRLSLLFLLSAILTVGCGSRHSPSRTIDDGTHKWTFLIYMAADNNLEPYALQDFNELEQVGSDPNISLLVQIDRSPEYDTSDGNWTTTRRYYVTRDTDTSHFHSLLLQDLGELDMASPATLADFVQWGTSNYPADHYVLILWNHGRGWQTKTLAAYEPYVKAIQQDLTSGTEMSLADLSQALSQTPQMDVIAFDSCLMAMIEVAYSIRNAGEIMVASEENVPVQGQPYEFVISYLKANPGLPPKEFCQRLVSAYVQYYAARVTNPVTYSAIDLTRLDDFVSAVDQMAEYVVTNINSTRTPVRQAQQQAQWYDHDYHIYDYYKDLYDFARLVKEYSTNEELRMLSDAVMTSLADVVIAEAHSGSQVANSHGISIYLPDSGTYSSKYSCLDFATDTHWDEMLRAY